MYFIMQTIATVGYGEIKPETSLEKGFCILLMVIGVSAFTYISGALSSLISNHDIAQADLQQKLLFF